MIEGRPVITEMIDAKAATQAGVHSGDIVCSVDGIDALERYKMLSKLFAVSTPQSLDNKVAEILLDGPDNSQITLQIEGSNRMPRTISMVRKSAYQIAADTKTYAVDGPIVKTLDGNIGYVDLQRLTRDMVDPMFEQLKGTRAIVFDMRGYPRGTGPALAARLLKDHKVTAAKFCRPIVFFADHYSPNEMQPQFEIALDEITKSTLPQYTGKTVVLVDERTISQSEHLALLLKSANETVLIGAPTAGTDGNVTNFRIPGQIEVYFSGETVSHSDDTPFAGLQPDILVKPTIAGIRAGKDEVLQKALDYLH